MYWLKADMYDEGRNEWRSLGSKGSIKSVVRGGILTKRSGAGSGASKSISYVQGTSGTSLYFGNLVPSYDFTICALTRYTGGRKGRILLGGGNWLFGHWANRAGVAHTQRWVTPTNNVKSSNWVAMCGKNGRGGGNILLDGKHRSNGQTVQRPTDGEVGVNFRGARSCCSGERSDYDISEIIVWKGDAIKEGMDYLMDVLKKGNR